MLLCGKCRTEKEADAFSMRRRNTHRNGRHEWCKQCMKEQRAGKYGESKRAHNVRYRAQNREWHLRQRRIHQAARRARKLGQFIEHVDPDLVYRIFGGRCGICGLFIEGDFQMDHCVALANGGLHGYINVQPAHPFCNGSKGVR